MPIQFACPRCAKRLSIGTRKAGATINCPVCNQKVIVPTTLDAPQSGILIEPLSLPEPEQSDPLDFGSQRPHGRDDDDDDIVVRRRKRGAGNGPLLAVGLLGVVTVAVVLAAVSRLSPNREGAKAVSETNPTTGSR